MYKRSKPLTKALNWLTLIFLVGYTTTYILIMLEVFKLDKEDENFAKNVLRLIGIQLKLTGTGFIVGAFLFLVVGIMI